LLLYIQVNIQLSWGISYNLFTQKA